MKLLFFSRGPYYSWKKVCALLFGSTASTMLLSLFFLNFIGKMHEHSVASGNAQIKMIMQTGPRHRQLSTFFLAELLGLSVDQKQNIYDFDVLQAEKVMMSNPIIQHVHLRKIKPNALYIDYIIRTPIALLGNYENTAIDKEGILFPLHPFYFPQKIPTLYLKEHNRSLNYGSRISDKELNLMHKLYQTLNEEAIESMDMSRIYEATLGKRELIVTINEPKARFVLRMTPKDYLAAIDEYHLLKKEYLAAQIGSFIIDLRLPHIAYIKNC